MLYIVLFILVAAFIFLAYRYYVDISRLTHKRLTELSTEYAAKHAELRQLEEELSRKERDLRRNNDLLRQQRTYNDELKLKDAEIIRQNKEEKTRQAQSEYEERVIAMKDAFRQLSSYLNDEFNEQADEIKSQLNGMVGELDATRTRVTSINNTIKILEEEELRQDFYKLKISRFAKEDIQYLLSIEDKVHNKDILHKLIWSTYLQPAFNDMAKRVLNNKTISGIYKITDSNGKAYIGRSTNVKNRWSEHIKASLGIGNIAHYGIHDALRHRGWDDFTFQLIEEAPKEELGTLEKYYIDYFDTNTYGYNKNIGG